MIGRFAWGLAGLALVFATGEIHARIPPAPPIGLGEEFVPRPAVAKALSLGFDSALADYYWLQAVQVVGGARENPGARAETIARLIEVVTELDPWVDHPYRFAAIWLTESPESVRRANALLRRGIEHHPNEWRNYFYLGFNLYFYLDENAEAANVLERATQLSGAPPYLSRLVARLRTEATGDLGAAAIFLEQLIAESEHGAENGRYRAALDEIEVERHARNLDRAREVYKARHGRDIVRVEDLLSGPDPVLDRLPSPEPPSLPESLSQGSVWYVKRTTGRITSNWYGRRYELNFHPLDAKRREQWREQARGK